MSGVYLLDVNIVLAAYRGDHPQHAVVRKWFDEVLATDAAFGVPALVWTSFLRLATNRRIFPIPSPISDAFAFIDATSAQPNHLAMAPGPRHLHILRELCVEFDVAGDLVTDAALAAIAAEHGAEVVTLDRDFARFTTVPHALLRTS